MLHAQYVSCAYVPDEGRDSFVISYYCAICEATFTVLKIDMPGGCGHFICEVGDSTFSIKPDPRLIEAIKAQEIHLTPELKNKLENGGWVFEK